MFSTSGSSGFPTFSIQTSTTDTSTFSYSAITTETFNTILSGYTTITSYTAETETDADPFYTTTLITGSKATFTITYDPSQEDPDTFPTITVIATAYSTYLDTVDVTTLLTNTSTYDWVATIYQANTRGTNAEILFKIPAGSAYAVTPATNGAATGTRLTVTPSVLTSQILTTYPYTWQLNSTGGIVASRTGTTASFPGSTQTLLFTTTTTATQTLTAVSSNSIPHGTTTYTAPKTQTAGSSQTWQIWSPYTITYNYAVYFRATLSTTYRTHKTSYEAKTAISADISYHKTNEKRFVTTFTGTTEAYNTSYSSSFLTSEIRVSTNLQPGLSYTDSTSAGTTEVGNALILENPRIGTANSPGTSVQAFVTKGFVVKTGPDKADTTAGGWITANGSRTLSTFDGLQGSWYALEGQNISGTAIFPRTNLSYTFSFNSQTFTITSASGGSTITTTASHVIGVDGSTITMVDTGRSVGSLTRLIETVTNPGGGFWQNAQSAPFDHFGCPTLASGQTIVNRGGEGVYRNLINSSTVSLAGHDTAYSGASTATVSFLIPIKSVAPLTQGFYKNDIVWAEPRNSTDLPFYRLP